MSLAHNLADNAPTVKTGTLELGPNGGSFTGIRRTEPLTDWADVFRQFNLDPNTFEIEGDTVRMNSWQTSRRTEDGERDIATLYSYSARFRRTTTVHDLPVLYAAARRKPRPKANVKATERATIAVYADPQLGKTGRRGGTPEALERATEKRTKLDALLKARRPDRFVLADAGDGIEGFESGGNPMFTNDLSLTQQMDAYGTELFEFITLGARYAPVTIAAVPSNHAAWRRGKQLLGKPSDDLGLFVHRQVQKLTQAANIDTEWVYPNEYDESVAFTIHDTIIGLVHGNQFGPGQAINWWEKQAFGGQAIAHADILITGHYHAFGAGVAGINPATGRERMWLGAPTLDNGSDWYRQTAGRDSEPAMLVFDVTPNGLDLSSLTMI